MPVIRVRSLLWKRRPLRKSRTALHGRSTTVTLPGRMAAPPLSNVARPVGQSPMPHRETSSVNVRRVIWPRRPSARRRRASCLGQCAGHYARMKIVIFVSCLYTRHPGLYKAWMP